MGNSCIVDIEINASFHQSEGENFGCVDIQKRGLSRKSKVFTVDIEFKWMGLRNVTQEFPSKGCF